MSRASSDLQQLQRFVVMIPVVISNLFQLLAIRIAVVDGGGIAELGTHDELVDIGGRYAALSAAWEGNQHPPVTR